MSVRTLVVAVTGLATAATGLVGIPALAAAPSLAVTATSRSGDMLDPLAYALNLRTGKQFSIDAGTRKALPAGTYAVGAYILDESSLTVAARVVNVAGPKKVDFALRGAKKVVLKVDDGSVRATALAVVPFATVNGKPKKFLREDGIAWPPENTFVLPSKDKALSLGVHGVLGQPGDAPGPVRYDLAKAYPGLPAKVDLRATKAKLAKVNLDVSVIDAQQNGTLQLAAARPNRKAITGVDLGGPVLGKQVSYRSPGLQWATTLNLNGLAGIAGFAQLKEKFKRKGKKPFLYAATKTYQESWGQGVWGPRANSPAIFEQGGKVNVQGGQPICPFAGVGVTLDDCQLQPATFSYRLAKSGSAVSQGTAVSATLGPKPTWYTVTLSAKRQEGGDFMRAVGARWYFKAARGGPTGPVGAGVLRISPAGLDPFHRTASGSTPVQIVVADLAKVRKVGLEYSTDGGKTWKKAKTTGKATKWSAKVANPGGEETVSLRVRATAAGGAFVQYTVTDAYGVK